MHEEFHSPEINQNRNPQPQQPQQPQGWGNQQQWNFYDYGPIGQPAPQEPKKPKKEKKPGGGIRALAIIMTVLFVITAAAFAGYILLAPGVLPQDQPDVSRPAVDGDLFTEEKTPDGNLSEGVEGEILTNRQIYKKVKPAVVGIVCYNRSSIGTQAGGQGSGVIMREDGYIVTNNHVVRSDETGEPYDRIEVILANGDSYFAQFVGGDRQSDLAVLKIAAEGLTPAVFGQSVKMQVGDEVMAIGNPSGMALASSFTHGYVSAMNREVYVSTIGSHVEFMQTDAAINPGNSGGALVNAYGQVIGITSAKIVEEGFEGIGFAIPIDNAKPIIESLIANGYVSGRVQIGITYTPVSEAIAELNGIPRGLRVIDFDENADVAKKGIKRGDIITKLDRVEVYDSETVAQALVGKKPGDTITLTIYRVDSEGHAEILMIQALLSEKVE